MYNKILELIKKYPTIIIHRHKNPDGDALGSQIGLKNIILDSFPDKKVYIVGDMTARYAFIEGAVMDDIPDEYYKNALSIVLDTSAKSLISDDRYATAPESARFDHHIFCEKIADVELTDTSFESCCGLITAFACNCGLTVSAAAAKALYTGMVTDSGRFRYDATTAQTFKYASFLMERKFDTSDIYKNLYSDDLDFIKLRARFVLKIEMTSHRVAYIYTTRKEALGYGTDDFTLSRAMVNVMSEIKGIDSWVNFTETENGVLCEIRSHTHNINPIAVKYGGGGHAKASGATLKDKNEAMSLLSDLCALSKTGENK
ncbi:MAG: bifunctional oligoribonuclease/PAP phosphatase NrnA [Clostridia bacterium]|nr:bifunctional oligoribonuclease/PAP phosphatase NrnA [Clostridia bacterium]